MNDNKDAQTPNKAPAEDISAGALLLEDERWMAEALVMAEQGARVDEVPVGAVVVCDGQIIGRGYNQPITSCNPVAHAEMLALQEAAKNLDNYRLLDCTLYVTLEPCTMCSGALVHARIKRVVYGATEPKAGAVESQAQILEHPAMNHCVEHQGGVLSEQCSALLSAFFKRRRAEKKAERKK